MTLPATLNQAVLETERLLLKELDPEIIEYIFTSCSDKDIAKYLALNDEELAVEKYKFEKGLTTHQTSFKNFLMVEKTSGRVVGKCGFHTWFMRHSRAEVGYAMLDEKDKGKGLMSEALKAIVIYGFEQLDLNRIEALIGSQNTASLALVKRLGFTNEGTLREHYYKYPRIEDSISFSLLKREYELLKKEW